MDNKRLIKDMISDVVKDGTDVEEIEELINSIGTPSSIKRDSKGISQEIDLAILDEPDWRKRAQLAAMKISIDLDD